MTFQECRAYLKVESTKGYCQQTVLRLTQCILGLYTARVLLYLQLPKTSRTLRAVFWKGKTTVTFSNMMTWVCRAICEQWFSHIQADRIGHQLAVDRWASDLRVSEPAHQLMQVVVELIRHRSCTQALDAIAHLLVIQGSRGPRVVAAGRLPGTRSAKFWVISCLVWRMVPLPR
jgi:hypothetical protein